MRALRVLEYLTIGFVVVIGIISLADILGVILDDKGYVFGTEVHGLLYRDKATFLLLSGLFVACAVVVILARKLFRSQSMATLVRFLIGVFVAFSTFVWLT